MCEVNRCRLIKGSVVNKMWRVGELICTAHLLLREVEEWANRPNPCVSRSMLLLGPLFTVVLKNIVGSAMAGSLF